MESVGYDKVPQRVLEARHAGKGALRHRHPSVQPERVTIYTCAAQGSGLRAQGLGLRAGTRPGSEAGLGPLGEPSSCWDSRSGLRCCFFVCAVRSAPLRCRV